MIDKYKKMLINDLRSGQHEQAIGNLRKGNAFCCLGRLCDLVKAEVGLEWNENLLSGEVFFPPHAISRLVDLTHADAVSLADRNDGVSGYKQHTFAEIADYIEKEL